MSERSLLKNMSWLTLISGVERVAAVLQTVLLARALGITEYGVYGLIFGTIGLAASIAGLQMGLTGTVFVARYRNTEKSKARFVIAFVNRFSIAVALLFLLCAIPFAGPIAGWLIGPSGSKMAIVAGCLLIAFSIISGVQDGVIQGFEDFRSVALARLATTVVTLVCIYPASVEFGLLGAMTVVLLGLLVKYLLLTRKLQWHCRASNLPTKGEGLRGRDLMWGFSFPSMLVSLLVGAIGWSGTVVLSRQTNGFDALAIVNTGLQWRGPIFLLTSAISSVAIPAISRHYQAANHTAIRGMQQQVLLFNGVFALLISAALIALSPLILLLYGPGFADGALVFSLMVASALPQVIAGVYMQHLVAKGRMWQQLFLHLWLVVPLGIGFATIIPRFHSEGFALVNFTAWTIFAAATALNARTAPRLSTNSPIE
jgi:O-antigen/teichoic acid export membrane protein